MPLVSQQAGTAAVSENQCDDVSLLCSSAPLTAICGLLVAQ